MTNAEVLTAVLSIVAIIVSMFALFQSRRANEIAKRANDFDAANVELNIHQTISSARRLMSDLSLKMLDHLPEGEREPILKALHSEYFEAYLNALEVSCMKYIDGKVDKERFRKTYSVEVRQAFETPDGKQSLGVGSPYTALKRVYDEWFNLERSK